MKHISITGVRTRARKVITLALGIFFVFAPAITSAAGASVQTAQLLPPGQNFCEPLQFGNVEPHVYGGMLESFDVSITDYSYVGLFAVVGSTQIPLQMISRWPDQAGERIHVDLPSTVVGKGLPVTLTLLSAPAGAPVCISVVSFDVVRSTAGNGAGNATTAAGNPSRPRTGSGGSPTHVSNSGSSRALSSASSAGSSAHKPSGKIGSAAATHKASTTPHKQVPPKAAASTTLPVSPVTGASTGAPVSASGLNLVCAGNNAYKLWFVLLIIYVILVAVVVFAEPWFLRGSVLGSTASILIPLILLLAFWYFSPICRAASWIPVAACVIAVVGLFLAFREYEGAPVI